MRRFFVFVVALALPLAAVACSSSSDAEKSVPVFHEGDAIKVGNGTTFVVALSANPSTGYSWSAGDNPNVTYVSSKQVDTPSAPPGASGEQQLTFKATKTGHSTLDLAYARSFEKGVPPAETASFDVTVT
jgi:predicted secreted protein